MLSVSDLEELDTRREAGRNRTTARLEKELMRQSMKTRPLVLGSVMHP